MWDEPETHLNPELYPLVAEILIEHKATKELVKAAEVVEHIPVIQI